MAAAGSRDVGAETLPALQAAFKEGPEDFVSLSGDTDADLDPLGLEKRNGPFAHSPRQNGLHAKTRKPRRQLSGFMAGIPVGFRPDDLSFFRDGHNKLGRMAKMRANLPHFNGNGDFHPS
jgi:hypothetical protein